MIPGRWRELAEFQLHIAERWRDRGRQAQDPFARFFFCFAGVNAIYFLWSKIDDLRNPKDDGPPNEGRMIKHLLGKASVADCSAVLDSARSCVAFFSERPAIERMDKRLSARTGETKEGRKELRFLRTGSELEKLRSLGLILYFVRSNLVHGSKMDQGDDQVIIESAVPGLEAILDWAIEFTRAEIRSS